MRVVIDTGVFFSAAIKAQTVPGIAVYRAGQRGVLLKSRSTEAELVEVIDRPRLARLIAPAARARLVELMSLAELVTITERIAECCDPKDDKFLELAVNGKTDVIVSGDADLLVLNPFRGVSVCKRGYFDETARRVDYMLNALGPNGYLQRMCALQAKSSKLSWSGQGGTSARPGYCSTRVSITLRIAFPFAHSQTERGYFRDLHGNSELSRPTAEALALETLYTGLWPLPP